MEKTFILGLGTQKAGTTWFRDYLPGLNHVDMGFSKEYHVFDALTLPGHGGWYWRALRDHMLGRVGLNGGSSGRNRAAYWPFLRNTERYFDYFEALLDQDGVFLTGDITPSYSGLDAATLRRINDGFQKRGIRVRPVFFMRDPVERCWSAVRMGRRNAVKKGRKGVRPFKLKLSEEQHLMHVAGSRQYRLRTEYHRTIGQAEDVFGAGEVIEEFFERLFTPAAIKTICARLGLDYREPDFARATNVSGKSADIPVETKRRVALLYKDVYSFLEARYSPQVLEELWPSYRLIKGEGKICTGVGGDSREGY
jgi:hypothetical protein